MVEERMGFRVTGRVQGVGFRFWTRRTALELGVRGAVRNAGDGAVEVSVAGPPDAVSGLERRLAQGPPGAGLGFFMCTGRRPHHHPSRPLAGPLTGKLRAPGGAGPRNKNKQA